MSQRLPGAHNPYAYRRGPPRRRGKVNDDPEHRLQVAVAVYFTFAMPDEYVWTASVAGMRGSIYQGVKAKAAGLKKGWPDLQILFPSAVTRYIELKASAGGLSDEQKTFRDFCKATGRDIWALCRTPEEVEAQCLHWKIPMKCALARASRYANPEEDLFT